jgi:DNA-binding MarR family transcriptional regulator
MSPGLAAVDIETSVSDAERLELRVWLRLLACANLIEGQVRRGLRDRFETTLPRFDVMAQLDRAPQGLTMSALSRRLMVSNGNVTGLIDRLAAEGLVETKPEAGDRRSLRVRLSPAGKAAFDAMTPVHEGWIVDLFRGLDRQDMGHLHALLAKLKAGVSPAAEGKETDDA